MKKGFFPRKPSKKKQLRREMLPDFWRRTARPEAKRRPNRLTLDIRLQENGRLHDLHGNWSAFGHNLAGIEHLLGVKLPLEIGRQIKAHNLKKVKVLDLGCGPGVALAELKKRFGSRIKTTGIVLERTPEQKYAGVDRLIVGDVNKVNPHETFDVIYSASGAVARGGLKVTALENAINWLKPGGFAAINIGIASDEVINEMKTVLLQNGIKKWRLLNNMTFVFRKPMPKIP